MVGRDDDVARERRTTIDERPLAVRLDVTRQQCAPAASAHAQHAGAVVVRPARLRLWMQQLEIDIVPSPALAGDASLSLASSAAQNTRYRNGTDDRLHSAAVIAVVMT